MTRLLFDFPPNPGASPVRRVFADPVEVVRARTIEEVGPALGRVQRAVLEERLSAAGYLAYESAPAFDSAFRVRSGGRAPLLWFGLFEGVGDPLSSPPPGRSGDPDEVFGPWALDISAEGFTRKVERIHRAIEAGETYQVNYTARYRTRLAASGGPDRSEDGSRDPSRDQSRSRSVYEQLRASQGDGYHALLELDGHTIVSASPELFFQLRGRTVTVRPMKGTRPRGRWLEEDDALARELRQSEKEQAENRMIVDLLRNDLGRVAETGSVRVPRVFDVERYRTVLQMTSTVTGTLPPGLGFVVVLEALFPSGSVTGAPKIQTMKLIAELESSPREVYCGAIGYVEGGSGDAVFSVPIRTLRMDRSSGTATYGTGSGITWSSTPEDEFREMQAKARILSERWPDFDLLETLRLEGGRYRRLDRHLSRMRNSARYFARPFPEAAIREAMEEVARERAVQGAPENAVGESAVENGPGHAHKVRVTLSETGEVRVDVEPLGAGTIEGTPDSTPASSAGIASCVALASSPVDSSDRFLFHKTTHRTVYDSHRADHADMFDVLLWNEKDEITEFCRGNVVVEIDGRRLTPPRSCGLLAGCFREELLDEGVVEEGRITRSELADAEQIWLVNSVRGWVPVRLRPAEPDGPRAGERLQRQDDA